MHMSTPHQLDSYIHGVEGNHDDVTIGDWNDAVESTSGSMGGESNRGVVRVFVVVEGAGRYFCCGSVGLNGARFCTSHPGKCGFKSHLDKKANVKAGHVYLGSDSGNIRGWNISIMIFATLRCCTWHYPLELFMDA
jgi:hypothetical protein